MGLDEWITAFQEIKAAREVDLASKGRKLPQLTTIASVMRSGEFNRLTPELWQELADFLEGKHRRKPGDKFSRAARQDDATLWNEVVQHKSKEVLAGKPERGLTTAALNYVAGKYKLDDRDLNRRLKRHSNARIKAVQQEQQELKNMPEDI